MTDRYAIVEVDDDARYTDHPDVMAFGSSGTVVRVSLDRVGHNRLWTTRDDRVVANLPGGEVTFDSAQILEIVVFERGDD